MLGACEFEDVANATMLHSYVENWSSNKRNVLVPHTFPTPHLDREIRCLKLGGWNRDRGPECMETLLLNRSFKAMTEGRLMG